MSRRLHVSDPQSALYPHFQNDPDRALRATSVKSTHPAEESAIAAEQSIYDDIPPGERLNRARPS